MDVLVVGNVAIDIACYPVEDVPRYDALSFEKAVISPGGCGSNVAIGLAANGVDVGLQAVCGDDESANLMISTWRRWGIDLGLLRQVKGASPAVSIAFIDREYQPRFVHTSGVNGLLVPDILDVKAYCEMGVKFLVVVGYFVLPGLFESGLAHVLQEARRAGIFTLLDVVHSPLMKSPESLWPNLPHLDIFLCNEQEAELLTGFTEPEAAANYFRLKGAKSVIIKLGDKGCGISNGSGWTRIPGVSNEHVVDTTGAGDAFAAGLVAGLLRGDTLYDACAAGNLAGSKIVSALGAISGWNK